MEIKYCITVTVSNTKFGGTSSFCKDFADDVTADTDSLLYNNCHVMKGKCYIPDLFSDEIKAYCTAAGISLEDVIIEEFDVATVTERVNVFFEDHDHKNELSLNPDIMVYIMPKNDALKVPKLFGKAYDSHTIIWTWEEDEEYSHYLVEEAIDLANDDDRKKIIAQLPIGKKSYVETGLEPDTPYTRRLINYTEEQTSAPSASVTVRTKQAEIARSLEGYKIPKEYDFTTDDAQREIIRDKMPAFHSGIGDYNDLKVYKQMDADFYQKFKAYFEITGKRIQRERKYDQVGFRYKICMEATETVEEQEGEVTFMLVAYPREKVIIQRYSYATYPVKVKAKVKATMFAYGPDPGTMRIPISSYEPIVEEIEDEDTITNYKNAIIVISIDCSTSMTKEVKSGSGVTRLQKAINAVKKLIRKLSKKGSGGTVTWKKDDDGNWTVNGDPKINKFILVFWATNACVSCAIEEDDGIPKALTAETAIKRLKIAERKADKGIFIDGPGDYSQFDGVYAEYNSTTRTFTRRNRAYTLAGNHIASRTNFYKGLTAARHVIEEIKSRHTADPLEAFQVFITDGFCNQQTDQSSPTSYQYFSTGLGTIFYGRKDYSSINSHGWKALRKKFLDKNNDNDSSDEGTNNFINSVTSSAADSIIDEQGRLILSSIREGLKTDNNKCKGTFFVFAAHWYKPDPSFNARWPNGSKTRPINGVDNPIRYEDVLPIDDNWRASSYPYLGKTQRNFQHIMFRFVRALYKKKYSDGWKSFICSTVPLDSDKDPDTDAGNLAKKMAGVCEFIKSTTVRTVSTEITGWQEADPPKYKDITYSVDSTIPIEIETDPIECVFDETGPFSMPVEYDEDEKRVIVKKTHSINDMVICPDPLYKMIEKKFEESEAYKNGYTSAVTDEDGRLLVKGLTIYDSYAYADEDGSYPDPDSYDLGRIGSINVYAKMDKNGTDTVFGDDTYLLSSDSRLMLSGYTDAHIYDDSEFISVELNSFDRDRQVLIDPSVLGSSLTNRKQPTKKYPGSLSSVTTYFQVIQKDEDIQLRCGTNVVEDKGDYIKIDGGDKVEAIIDKKFMSPVLHYRFNLEDPEAMTSLYEILPGSNPRSNFLHIVKLNIYYARNVNVWGEYIYSFGATPYATTASPVYTHKQGVNLFSLKDWEIPPGLDNCKYIDEYIWFYAKPCTVTRPYYDELPGNSLEPFYGLVNGRYHDEYSDGKKDLVVDTPQFNIPTTIKDKNSIRIYIKITEFSPDDALVSYKWEHSIDPLHDDITNVNGDYVTFYSDSITYKDVPYYDVIETINKENQEVFDNKTTVNNYQILKSDTVYDYVNYYLNVTTDNSDVLAMRYPKEITFDDKGIADIEVAFKGIVNATSMWSPRIHNGYYYLNQHEAYAYSEFNVEADFCKVEETNFKTANGYLSIDVKLRHAAGATESYIINKDTRSQLLQDERSFQWIDGKGVTLLPSVDGVYYKSYPVAEYFSPVLMFPKQLTEAGALTLNYTGSNILGLQIRYYDIDEGKWSGWSTFANGTVPAKLSYAYQLSCKVSASCINTDIDLDDYICCYLDWKDEMDAGYCENITYVTDYIQTESSNSPTERYGTYVSKIIDYGCESNVKLDWYQSNLYNAVGIHVAYANNRDLLLMENISWEDITNTTGTGSFKGRYFRYMIVVPEDEKLFYLHRRVTTKQTTATLPYITGITMAGKHKPSDIVMNFINTEAFEILKDAKMHTIFPNLADIIEADVLERGYAMAEVQKVSIECTTKDITLDYDKNMLKDYPGSNLNKPINATASLDYNIDVKKTPYIYVKKDDDTGAEIITIHGTPQQYSPITVEDENGNTYTRIYDVEDDMLLHESFKIGDETKYIELKRNDYELSTLAISLNGTVLTEDAYERKNHLIIFRNELFKGDKVEASYRVPYSFRADIDRAKDVTVLHFYSTEKEMLLPAEYPKESVMYHKKLKVFFETNKRNNKFIANKLSFNPIYRTSYNGFVYLTDEHNEPYKINIYCNPTTLKAGGYDKVDIAIEVLDILNNPVINKPVSIDSSKGIINCDNYNTDMNGVVHLVYESSVYKSEDMIKARVQLDDGVTELSNSITIKNE